MSESQPQQPLVDADSAGFWEATARSEFALRRCQACRRWVHPPKEHCPTCAAPTSFEQASGEGVIVSWTVVNTGAVSGYAHHVPYVVALVDLDDQPGLRFSARVVDGGDTPVRAGQRVRVVTTDLAGGAHRIPVFVRTGVSA